MSLPTDVLEFVAKLDRPQQAQLASHLKQKLHEKALEEAIAFSDCLDAQLRVLGLAESADAVLAIHDRLLTMQTRPNG